jgi:hypothetical protein
LIGDGSTGGRSAERAVFAGFAYPQLTYTNTYTNVHLNGTDDGTGGTPVDVGVRIPCASVAATLADPPSYSGVGGDGTDGILADSTNLTTLVDWSASAALGPGLSLGPLSATTGVYTVPEDGIYQIDAQTAWVDAQHGAPTIDPTSDGTTDGTNIAAGENIMRVMYAASGAALTTAVHVARDSQQPDPAAADHTTILNVSKSCLLATGDQIFVEVTHTGMLLFCHLIKPLTFCFGLQQTTN